jgi:methylenetetrahydrofolate dehydrogenase (NADP+) / methenyltetrahydrofolate cyclohydrolase
MALLDGKLLAAELRAELAPRVAAFVQAHGRKPGLDVVLVGEDPASVVYTRNKEKAAQDLGMRSTLHRLPKAATQAEVLARIESLNSDDAVDGILVQLPLPEGLDPTPIVEAVRVDKDVDGFHPVNVGLLSLGRNALVACTPQGCMRLLRGLDVRGKHTVVIGRSNIVGKPMAQLLLAADATVTVAHSKTRGLPELCQTADILVAAIGRPEFVRGSWIKPGAIVLDVGINRVDGEGGKSRLVGDVAFAEAEAIASYISPVPGGVGPMTIACLLANTLQAAESRLVNR